MRRPLLSLGDARAAFPKLGLALYAYDPTGPLTLEVISAEGQTFTFSGPTEDSVIARAFPSLAEVPEAPEPTIEPSSTTQPNVFD